MKARGRVMYHYTSREGLAAILQSKRLLPSLRANNARDARFGDGQYLSDVVPGTKRPGQLSRIFFGILTLALSQVLYSLALKISWITGGTDGLRVARPSLLFGLLSFTGAGSFQRFLNGYYYYVLVVSALCVAIMWVIVHSPFGHVLVAIRDNEPRAQALGYAVENPTGFGRRVPGVVSRVRFGCFGFVVPLVAAFDRHFAFDWMFRCDAVGDQLL